ncbi:hypothetical protein [Winogradskyella sp. UBA3174]|uniref:hypothetical protein n=1 Tax=Winogradskyella sp. UBA3174 TaxID=1947785 RepID=UPI0025F639E5|nr:hypothetical protein [Winogradskyella sp. UBA3174]|tara:strand:- start:15318 stop:16937 length:1620 start_codon:yes stop_codon:yes gene_type:complete
MHYKLKHKKWELKDEYVEVIPQEIVQKKYIGKGRSAKVYLSYSGNEGIATKTFTGEPVSKLILFILTGSANPYTWCEDAIECAMIRRRILSSLCQIWFKDKLRLPKTFGYRWNEEHKAFEIDAEYIPGKHAPLFNPLDIDQVNYMSELKNEIMKPLKDKLIESGFDGLVWQAGKGNPVAVSNFMMLNKENGTRQWIWIDLESGLPALFAMNPLSTLFYYIPKCIKHRDWLFDHVDSTKLSDYLKKYKDIITSELGKKTYQNLCDDVDILSKKQKNWKGLSRHQKSLYYAASQKKITEESKLYYENKPLPWFLKNSMNFLKRAIQSVKNNVVKLLKKIYNFRYQKFIKRVYRYFSSVSYRWRLVRWYLKKEIDKWHSRKFLTESESKFLKGELQNDDKSSYLTDFSIHIGIKPFVKVFSFIIMPILIASGVFSIQNGAIIILAAGPLARTLYTVWRMSNSLISSKPQFPIIALIVGLFPVIGNLAYPAELIYQSKGRRNKLSKFIIYSFSAKAGSKVPIWGGKDSEIEHIFNRICHFMLK